MRRSFIFILTLIIFLTVFTTVSYPQDRCFQLSPYFSGNIYVGNRNFVYGPMLDFNYFPLSFEEKGMGLPLGFGLTAGFLMGFKNTQEEGEEEPIPYNLIPIQANMHVDYDFTPNVAKGLFFTGQFKIGVLLGLKPNSTEVGMAITAGLGLKYYFVKVFGIVFTAGCDIFYIENRTTARFKFSGGFIFRF